MGADAIDKKENKLLHSESRSLYGDKSTISNAVKVESDARSDPESDASESPHAINKMGVGRAEGLVSCCMTLVSL